MQYVRQNNSSRWGEIQESEPKEKRERDKTMLVTITTILGNTVSCAVLDVFPEFPDKIVFHFMSEEIVLSSFCALFYKNITDVIILEFLYVYC